MLPDFPCELWQLRPLPSIEDDSKEQTVKACRFIQSLGRRLNFPLRTVATAQTYFHVFFHEQTHLEGREQRYPPMDIALTALLVASKAEETFKKIRAILSAAFIELNPSFAGSDVDVNIVEDHRKRIIQYEEILLVTIQFNFNVRHPFGEPLARICRYFDVSKEMAWKTHELLQQMYCSPIVIYYPPHCLILAALFQVNNEVGGSLSLALHRRLLTHLQDPFNTSLEDLEDVLNRFKPYRVFINKIV